METSYSEQAFEPRIDWGDALAVSGFYGRAEELALLSQWILREDCRVVSVLGMGGIGKSALSVNIIHQMAEHFEVVIFRSLRDAPSCGELLDDCLQVLSPQSLGQSQEGPHAPAKGAVGNVGTRTGASPVPTPTPTEKRISLLLSHLCKVRVLLVLDNLECLLQEGNVRGHFRPGFEEYGLLLRRVVEAVHQSCLLFTSREKPAELRLLEGRYPSVRSLCLTGLDVAAGKQLLEEKGVAPISANLRGHGRQGQAQPLQYGTTSEADERPMTVGAGLAPAFGPIDACAPKSAPMGVAPGIGTEEDAARLIEVYAGNPLALKIVAEAIVEQFGGKIDQFLAEGTVIFGSINDLLDEQFARLSALEQTVLYWLAIMREPGTLDELLAQLVPPLPRCQMLLEAVDGLWRRSLIESGKRAGSFTLQSVVLEYVTAILVTAGIHEIQQGQLDRLIQYGLTQATAREYVRQTQERLLLSPLLAELQSAYSGRVDSSGQPEEGRDFQTTDQTCDTRHRGGARHRVGARHRGGGSLWACPIGLHGVGARHDPYGGHPPPVPVPTPSSVEVQLLFLLDELRKQADDAQGYGPANLITLLRVQRGDLSGLDLSKLSIRGAYLQGIEMQEASLRGAQIRDTIFTEAISATWTVAMSRDGKWWAAGSMQGSIRIWDGSRSQTLLQIWQAHSDIVESLAFSPDGRVLASGSLDGTIKLWNMDTGTLLWTGKQMGTQSLAFTPDGSLLASGGYDATVRLWDPQSGANLQTLIHDSHVYAVAWSPDGYLLATGGLDGKLRLWKRQKASPSICVELHSTQTKWVTSLTFAPNGRTLASTNWDLTVKLWEVPSLRLLHTLPERTISAKHTAWSPDGRLLASDCYEKTIRLWDVEQSCYRAALVGHANHVTGMAFTPDGRSFLSSSIDGTLRVWDVERCQCVRVITGYAVSLRDIDWSPDGTQLVSGSTDGLVTIWDLHGGVPPQALHGHPWVVQGVGWSPDGKFLASAGWVDVAMRLWDSTSHACVQMFEGPSTILEGIAWSPDGSLLAAGTYQQGVQVWDVAARRLRWVERTHLTTFMRVAWSPDGTQLVSGGDDGRVYLWKGADGTLLERLEAHHGRVMSVGWSPDGTRLASGSDCGGSGELFVWEMQRGMRVQTLAQNPGVVYALAWSPIGDLLISGGGDGKLRWWNVYSGECVRTQEAHQGTVQSLRISPDGKLLASCGDDGAIMIWDLSSAKHLRTLRGNRPYERLNITGIRGLTQAQKATLQTLGAFEEATSSFMR